MLDLDNFKSINDNYGILWAIKHLSEPQGRCGRPVKEATILLPEWAAMIYLIIGERTNPARLNT
jgi:hypothetical protein